MSFKYTTRESLQEFINKRASLEVDMFNRPLNIGNRPLQEIKCILILTDHEIQSLKDIQFPEVIKCTQFYGYSNMVTDADLKQIRLSYNQITTLDGVKFPHNLTDLYLTDNKITTLSNVVFPHGLVSLDLTRNKINSFKGMQFPLSLINLKLEGNPIDVRTVSELKNPSPFVIREIVAAFPETGPHFQRMEEEKEEKIEQLFKMLYALNMKKDGGAKRNRKTCRKMKKRV